MCTSRRANCALVGPSVCEMSTAQDAVLAVGKRLALQEPTPRKSRFERSEAFAA